MSDIYVVNDSAHNKLNKNTEIIYDISVKLSLICTVFWKAASSGILKYWINRHLAIVGVPYSIELIKFYIHTSIPKELFLPDSSMEED
jgi:dolichyl-phosphate-mannose--protein O-mannosyl transferase